MYDMTIRLQTDRGISLYEQIYGHIKGEIRDGKLLAGERLPSTRSLAEYLQVARSTVESAYGQLMDEGYIEPRPYKGYFVCPMEELAGLEGMQGAFDDGKRRQDGAGRMFREEGRRSGFPESLGSSQDTRSRGVRDGSPAVIDFSPVEIDMSGFPFSVWKKITRNILTDANSDLFARGEAQGDLGLRQTICRYLHSSRGVDCGPEQIIIGAGNDYLLLMLEKILGRHVPVAMENPTYIRSYQIFRSFAYPVVALDMEQGGMQPGRLREVGAKVAYVMPSHQFPTGTVMPVGRRMELLRWASGEEDRYLIEDDYDSEFRFRGKPIPALQSLDRQGKVIYIGTFSKSIAPAIRVSFMVLPLPLLKVYKRDCAFYSCTVSRIDQRILDEFIRDGYFERHLNKMRKFYRDKHELLLEKLVPLEKRFTISGENAGLHLLLRTKENVPEGELLAAAAGAGVRVYGMSEYGIGASGEGEDAGSIGKGGKPGAVLLGFGGLSLEQIREGVERLEKAW